MYEIVVGRNEADKKALGLKGTVFLGKHYVKMGQTTSMSNKIFMDVTKSHVVLISGKRCSGKSYLLGVIAEEMAHLPEEVKNKIAVVMFDTMGIFWTMRYENVKDEDLLDSWNLPKKSLDINIYTPAGYFKEYKEKDIPADFEFTLNPSELNTTDWCSTFAVLPLDPVGILIENTISELRKKTGNYDIKEIINILEKNEIVEKNIKNAAMNLFKAAEAWGIFSKNATPVKNIFEGGKVSVIDISAYKEWNVKNLVIGLVCKKLMQERMLARKKEELEDVKKGYSYFSTSSEETGKEMPLVWIFVDECHESLPRENKTPATDALVTLLREGRQPGISLILATQQPGEIHKDVITQTDIVISLRVTAKKDIDALNEIMQTYLSGDLLKYFNMLPKMRGAALVLDDNSEKIYPVQIRPRFTWHGGEAPTLIKSKGEAAEKLGL